MNTDEIENGSMFLSSPSEQAKVELKLSKIEGERAKRASFEEDENTSHN